MMSPIPDNNFVFLDEQGRRWPRFRLFILISSAIVFLCSVVFVQSLFVMSQLQMPVSIQTLKERLKVLQKKESLLQKLTSKPVWLEFSRISQTGQKQAKSCDKSQPPAGTTDRSPLKRICLGFYAGWDPNSFSSLQTHADQLTHVCPEWLTMEDGTGTLTAKPDRIVQALAQKKGIILLPLLNNLTKDDWQPEAVEGVANGPEDRQSSFVSNLMVHLETAGAGGVVIDWGQVDPTYRDNVTRLLQRIAASLHAKNMELWLRVPMGRELKVFDIEALSGDVDRFIAVLHDENSEMDQPGPVASQDWFDGWLDAVVAYSTPSQWIVEMGLYGYDWASGERKAETISFADVMTRAGRAGLQSNEVTAPVYNPNFSYTDAGIEHTVWFLDVATFVNQLKSAMNLDVGGVAIFQLGLEDPAIWTTLQMNPFDANFESLAKISDLKSSGATQVGSGEFLTIEDTRSDGIRNLSLIHI